MARKKRFGGFKRKASRAYRGIKRRYSKSRHTSGNIIQLPAMAYGALRNPVANVVMPYTHGVTGMLGEYEDEAIMLGASWAMARFGSGFIADTGKAGLTVENANIGATLTKGVSLGGAGGSSMYIN